MRTVGIDLAAESERTAVAWLDWSRGRAVLADLRSGAGDEVVLAAITGADKAGLDCPLGWPEPFVQFVTDHQHGTLAVPPATGLDWRRTLTTRLTDRTARAETGIVPLSVSADRIGHVAIRCAGLLARLPQPVDRSGAGLVAEVYPAASLKRWGLRHRSYKGAGQTAALGQLVTELRARTGSWLDLRGYDELCRESHDALDAVIAGLTARAAALGLTAGPRPDQVALARTEGWIAIPAVASLEALCPA